MFAKLKLVLRRYTSLYGIFMSASLTLYSYRIILNYIVGLSVKVILILTNSTDSDKCCISSDSSLFPKVPV